MKIIFCVSALLFAQTIQNQDYSEVAGNWSGFIQLPGQELPVSFTFSYSDHELDGTLDIPVQHAFNLPVEFTLVESDSLVFQFETGSGPAHFRGTWEENAGQIRGEFEQAGMSFPFSIKKDNADSGNELDPPQKNLLIPTRAGQIAGSLILLDEPAPLVILLSGSGTQDRNENIAGFRVFRKLSYALLDAGYQSFRFDDRGVGESTGEMDATIEDLSEDLTDIIRYLKENHQDSFTEIILLGHSQGGLVASLAALEEEVSGIIFMASPFLRGDEIINQQIRKISESQNIPAEITEQNLIFQSRIYDVIRENGDWDDIEKNLAERLEEQIDQLPPQQREALGDMTEFLNREVNRQLAGARTAWFKSFINYDPATSTTALDLPMLAVFGEKDIQVIAENNSEAVKTLVEEYGLPLNLATIPEANHLFQKANSGLPAEYGTLEREFADGFIDTVINWLNSLD